MNMARKVRITVLVKSKGPMENSGVVNSKSSFDVLRCADDVLGGIAGPAGENQLVHSGSFSVFLVMATASSVSSTR